MAKRWRLYIRMIIKNLLLFTVGVLLLDYMAVLGHINAELYNSDGRDMGLISKKELVKDHLRVVYEFFKNPHAKTRTGDEYYTFILKSLLLVLFTELFILTLGLYIGLRAGYKGGWTDRILSVLAPVFSAIPSWFIAAVLLYTLYWKMSLFPIDFEGYLRNVSIYGGSIPRHISRGLPSRC